MKRSQFQWRLFCSTDRRTNWSTNWSNWSTNCNTGVPTGVMALFPWAQKSNVVGSRTDGSPGNNPLLIFLYLLDTILKYPSRVRLLDHIVHYLHDSVPIDKIYHARSWCNTFLWARQCIPLASKYWTFRKWKPAASRNYESDARHSLKSGREWRASSFVRVQGLCLQGCVTF